MASTSVVIFFVITCSLFPALLHAQTAASSFMGASCVQDSECGSGAGLVCYKSSVNCSNGECGCPTGYAFDFVLQTCLPATALGLPCGAGTAACRTINAACVNGICTCNSGYKKKRSPDGITNICEPLTATGVYGTPCYDSSYCLASLSCSPSSKQCGCDVGFTYTANPKRFCAPKGVGDSCASNDDCTLSNSYCTSGTCQCAGGYKSVNWRKQFQDPIRGSTTTWVLPVCIASEEPIRTTGQQCSAVLGRSQSYACDTNNICTPCNLNVNNQGFCVALVDSPASYASHTSVLLSSATSPKSIGCFIAILFWAVKIMSNAI